MKVSALTNKRTAAVPYSGNAPDAAGAFLLHISNLVSWPKPKEDITHTARARKKPTVPVVSAVNNGRTCKQGWRTNPDASVMNRHAHADVAEESSTPKLDEWDMKNAADRPVSFEFIRPDTPGQTDFPTLIPFPLPPKKKKITLLD